MDKRLMSPEPDRKLVFADGDGILPVTASAVTATGCARWYSIPLRSGIRR